MISKHVSVTEKKNRYSLWQKHNMRIFKVSPFFQTTKQHLNNSFNGEKWDVEYLS